MNRIYRLDGLLFPVLHVQVFRNKSSDPLSVKTFESFSACKPLNFSHFQHAWNPKYTRKLLSFIWILCFHNTKIWAENLADRKTVHSQIYHLMWPHHDEALTWLKLMALLTILLCWTNSQFNNKTLNKKTASAAYIVVRKDKIKSYFVLLLCYNKIEPEIEAQKKKKYGRNAENSYFRPVSIYLISLGRIVFVLPILGEKLPSPLF